MTMFYCVITQMNVTLDIIPKWTKVMKSRCFTVSTNNTMRIPYKNIFKRYDVTNIEEYIQLVTKSLKSDNVAEIKRIYEKNKLLEYTQNVKKEEQVLKNKIQDSISKIKISNIPYDITIRLLTTYDENDATKLYIILKETIKENIENAREYVEDFILKNLIFGIFVNNILAGFVIIHPSKNFHIDNDNDSDIYDGHKMVSTLYIQELIIHPQYRGNKLSNYLLEYCIMRCPQDKKYMSLMTMPDNYALQKIAESVGFIKQKKPSGDVQHSLLMVKRIKYHI